VSQSRVFQLERLYYGSLVDNGKRISTTPGVIARTPNVIPAQIQECLRMAPLPPPGPGQRSDDMPGALALYRGNTTEFILAKAQTNEFGFPQVLFILMPVAVLRWFGGNVLAFRSLAMMEMPSFIAIKQNLVPFEIRDPAPPTKDEQNDTLYDLMAYCQDSLKNVEGILAGLVQGLPLAIVNSPISIDKRLRFIQGLMNMLPVPARTGITFTTHIHEATASPAQIKFLSGPAEAPNHLVYDWASGKLLTKPPEDSYSRYMVAQLRLDPSLVIEQTEKLSRTAVWRASHRENLGKALAWVSRRAAIDQAVIEGQPADLAIVGTILREDPTLSDDLRRVYVRHVLAFALVLDQAAATDMIPAVITGSVEIGDSVYEQLSHAIQNNQGWPVYSLLERWMLTNPDFATAPRWHTLIQQAAKRHLTELFKQDKLPEAVDFITYLKNASPALHLDRMIPELVAIALPQARTNPKLANALFLLGVESLSSGEFQNLLRDNQFIRQLPQQTVVALSHLQSQPRQPIPPRVLDQGARAFGDNHRMLVLARFVEWAMTLRRLELLDTAALEAMLVIAQSPQAERFRMLIQHIVDDFTQVSIIQTLEAPGPRTLVQLLLQIGHYDQAIRLLEFYQNTIFRQERLADFARLAGEAFLMTPLPSDQLTASLQSLEGSQIRPEPRATIYCSTLINGQWAPSQEYAARRLMTMIFNDHALIKVIDNDNTLRLLEFFSRQKNALDTLRVAAALVDQALQLGVHGAVLVSRMWPHIIWNAEVTDAALELLRRYMRGAPLAEIPNLITFFKTELPPPVIEALRTTYFMRQIMGESGFMRFADDMHTAAQLFIDIATTYHSNKEPPPTHRLRRDLDTMSGGLSERDREHIASNISLIARQVYELGRGRRRGKPGSEEQIRQCKVMPQNGIEALHFISGRFSQQAAPSPLHLEREAMPHIFGTRSATMLLRESGAITRLLGGLQAAFQDTTIAAMPPQVLKAELDSLWGSVSLYNQRRVQDQFAEDSQHLADVIMVIADDASEKTLGGGGKQLETGQRQPHTAFEALRWIYGYFARRHTK
jgi:hypothetical protein